MATINFLYRSKKPESYLTTRLLFTHDNVNYVFAATSKVKVKAEYWKETHGGKPPKDVKKLNEYIRVNKELSEITERVLNAFEAEDPRNINKEWLAAAMYPKKENGSDEIPNDFLGYMDFYLSYKKNELSITGARRVRVSKHKMERLQAHLRKTILIKDINEDFKKKFQEYSNQEKYSQNTQQRELVLIKTICYHARFMGLEVHHQLDSLRLKRQSVNHVYLTFEEIEIIRDLELTNEHLQNARDWLVISCYTGQRVSDFMRFDKDMIRIDEGKHLLEFKQKKTGKLMTIPISKEVRKVLAKRNGDFPRAISDQKYNDYIKDVAEAAELFELAEGKKRIDITPKEKKSTWRDVTGKYPKWQLVSSHIGRRSFATNHYGKVPTSYLINITGHGSEKMFLSYIQKSNKDMAIDAYDYFN
ncbi:hypothetical protein DHD32_18775 [Arenibacter sp. TNZ]|uniref:tyrosine-type recombinase/integrase n=1 Tax=Arenibacter TaxID=178469 RepID=UPI000CD461BE|nr:MULTISPECIES: phage integrase SAM-like domain-containing protein [Arenibacter]MCM4173525.1 hypothetical protein [Arenibacter sp. TNZ]